MLKEDLAYDEQAARFGEVRQKLGAARALREEAERALRLAEQDAQAAIAAGGEMPDLSPFEAEADRRRREERTIAAALERLRVELDGARTERSRARFAALDVEHRAAVARLAAALAEASEASERVAALRAEIADAAPDLVVQVPTLAWRELEPEGLRLAAWRAECARYEAPTRVGPPEGRTALRIVGPLPMPSPWDRPVAIPNVGEVAQFDADFARELIRAGVAERVA